MRTITTKLTKKILNTLRVSDGIIQFIELYGIIGYSLNELVITGDYGGHMERIIRALSKEYKYDKNGNITESIDKDGCVVDLYTYDKNDNMLTWHSYDCGWSMYTYDDENNMLTYVGTDYPNKVYTYDKTGNMITCNDSNGLLVTRTYDENNNILSYNDTYGVCSIHTYDQHNKALSSTSAGNITTEYTYDSGSNLISIVTGKDAKQYEYRTYDKNNNMVSCVDSNGYRFLWGNLSENVPCQVFHHGSIILEIKLR